MKRLLLMAIIVIACVSPLLGTQLWVGESTTCQMSFLGITHTNVSWNVSGGYVSLSGNITGSRTATVTKYFTGTATVKCTYQYKMTSSGSLQTASKSWSISCNNNPLSINPTTMTLHVGEQAYIGASLTYSNSYSSYAQTQYGSSNSTIASVNSDGLVTAVAPGTTTINVYNNASANTCYCVVTVEAQQSAVSIPSDLNLSVGGSATLTPTYASATSYSWYSTNSSVASVSSSGVVRGVSNGTAQVYCKTANNITSNYCNVTVGSSSSSSSPLSFTAKNGTVTVKFKIKNGLHAIQYSTNGSNWSTYTSNTAITLTSNQTVRFRAASEQTTATAFGGFDAYSSSIFSFSSSNGGKVEADGNIMSLYGSSCPNLTLADYAFSYMFNNCTLLTKAPELPATSLSKYCYSNMFYGCSYLITAPTLPATTLASHCYSSMFDQCLSLTSAPALPATTLAEGCYWFMFDACGSLVTAPALPARNLAPRCYICMFQQCASLTQAPALPANNLAAHCYDGMFHSCTALTTPPALPANNLAARCYSAMFAGCTALLTTPNLPATTLADSCYYGMFNGCTSLKSIPNLPATIMQDFCYAYMFKNCSSLIINTSGPGTQWIIPSALSAFNSTKEMFTGTRGTMNGTPSVNTTYYISNGQHTVTVNANDPSMGSVSGGGTYNDGATVTLTATAYSGYHFVNWSTGQTSPTITVTVNSDMTLTANFAAQTSSTYSVAALANYSNRGTVTGSGQYNYGSIATLTATPNDGYEFKCWDNGENNRVIYVSVVSDTVITAIFVPEGTGVDDVEETGYIVYSNQNKIIVNGLAGEMVRIYDTGGRLVSEVKEAYETQEFSVDVAGVYIVCIDEKKPCKVIVK